MNTLFNVKDIIKISPDGTRLFSPISFAATTGNTIHIQANERKQDILYGILCGLSEPDSGHILINNADLYATTDLSRSLLRTEYIGSIPRYIEFIPEISLIDNLVLPQLLIGTHKRNAQNKILSLAKTINFNLNFNRSTKTLSTFQVSVCAVIKAVSTTPDILIFNDFLSNLNNEESLKMQNIISQLRPKNSILIYLSNTTVPSKNFLTQNIIL